jgi:cell wall-associated NlpC family hydrolase
LVPLCVSFQIEVTNTGPVRLLVGGVVLSNDGSVIGFPDRGAALYVDSGKTVKLSEVYEAGLPLDSTETVRVFGTLETERVDWYRLTQAARTRNGAAAGGALEEALDPYISGTRSAKQRRQAEASPFTVSTITFRVKANAGFLEPRPGSREAPTAREYSIPNFDARPYYPDNTSTALYKVLTQADKLAKTKIGYQQHEWKEGSDEKNLEKGIDCSRFTWFVFTRSKLDYSEGNASLPTAKMVENDSPMSKHFDRCDPVGPHQLGDLVVYRDDARGTGHVVMVIDAFDRLAVGSHGWDGTAQELKVAPLTGVQYQKIKYKPDWTRWDRPGMQAKACWRYRRFVEEARQVGGRPGMKALGADPCVAGCPTSQLVRP